MLQIICNRYVAALDYLSTPHRLIATSLVRVILGSIVALTYLAHIGVREFLWGPNGQIPYSRLVETTAGRHDFLNLYRYAPSEAAFNAIFAAGLVIAILYTLGVRTRATGILTFVFTWSLIYRNEEAIDGGYKMLLFILLYLMFADTGRYFSIESFFGRRSSEAGSLGSRILGLFHNYAVALCLFQVIAMYLFSTYYKMQGHMWQDGTALYYVLRDNEFNIPGISRLVYQSATLVTLGTYATLLLQGAFPWLVFHRKLKWLVLGAAASFHSGIALLMGLLWFSSIIISVDLLFIDDETFDAALTRLRSWVLRNAPSGRVVVIYDGTCGFCRRVVSALKRLDEPARVELVAAAPKDAMYVIADGQTHRGYWAFQVLLATLPSTWILAALMRTRIVSVFGEAIYGLIAKNRARLGCKGNLCTAVR